MGTTAHVDTFARDNLPPKEQWPELLFELPEFQYPDRLNCAAELLDKAVEAGDADRPVIHAPGNAGRIVLTYREVLRGLAPVGAGAETEG